MENLYDKIPITISESYVGYGKDDLGEMTKSELEKELKRTEREIENFREELASTGITTPSYVLKERIEDAIHYKKKVEYALANLSVNESTNVDNNHKFKLYKNKLTDYSK